jgi:flagellar protein FliO/FliZ
MNTVATGPGWGALLWFVVVLAAIPAVLWLLKRGPLARMAGVATSAPARVVGVLPLSAAQRVITIEVGQGEDRRWLVLGVTAQQISTLHTMAAQDAPAAEGTGATAAGFAPLLARLRQGGGGDAR